MTIFFRRFPALLSAVILAAHFLFHRQFSGIALSLAMIPLFFLRRRWAWALSCLFLVAGAFVWGFTAHDIAARRVAEGAPYVRMYLILGSVAAFALLAAWLLPRPTTVSE